MAMLVPRTIPTDSTLRRLSRERDNLREDPLEGCSAEPKDDNLFEWTGTIQGPQESPYANGTFHLIIQIPNDYPAKPPVFNFATKIYHPNIDSNSGMVGLSVLHRDWCPVLTISKLLLSLQAFLGEPDPKHALLPEIAHEYENKRAQYDETAKQWVEKFARE